MSAQPLPHFTLEQYTKMEDEAAYKNEFIAGSIHPVPVGSPRHCAIAANVGGEVGRLLKKSSRRVYDSNLRVAIMPADVITYANVTIVCGEPCVNPFDRNSIINPTVIFEVLSPSIERYDRGEKWARYQRLDSLQQYVLVSQNTPRVEHYTRREDGTWNYAAIEEMEATSVLQVQGVTLSLPEIYDKVTFEESGGEEGNSDRDGGNHATI